MPPKVLQKNKDNSNTPKDNSNSNKSSNNHNHNHNNSLPSARNAPKTPATRLKLEIRRLPPGLTLSEFEETLGEEWKPGKGRVDWREFRQGKVPGSRNASATTMGGSGKMPELGRCYVHVMKEEYVAEFERRFLGVVFRDAARSQQQR
jgi:regulator of nonsense transcripts 3